MYSVYTDTDTHRHIQTDRQTHTRIHTTRTQHTRTCTHNTYTQHTHNTHAHTQRHTHIMIGAYCCLQFMSSLENSFWKIIDTVLFNVSCYKHYSYYLQRYRFNTCKCPKGETITSYIPELHHLTEHCEFSTTLNTMLRNRLVFSV